MNIFNKQKQYEKIKLSYECEFFSFSYLPFDYHSSVKMLEHGCRFSEKYIIYLDNNKQFEM